MFRDRTLKNFTMTIIKLNKGTFNNPKVLDKKFKEDEYVILESGFYVLNNNVVISEMWGNSQVKEMRENSQVNVMCENSQVKEMWGNSQVKEMRGNSQVKEMWGNSQVKEMRENSQVNVMWENSQVNVMRGNSQVKEMWGNSQVNVMWENSQVKEMWENSQVKEMWGNSQVNVMWENSQVKEMWENSQVKEMRENSQVKEMRGNSQVKEMWGNSSINLFDGLLFVCKGFNFVRLKTSNTRGLINDTSTIVIAPIIENNFDVFSKYYPFSFDKKSAILYKAVHKKDNKYIANHQFFEYKIGEIAIEKETTKTTTQSCYKGLHISHLQYAVNFGKSWNDFVILECEVAIKDIIISKDCDGKVRTSKLKVLREVPKKEYQQYL